MFGGWGGADRRAARRGATVGTYRLTYFGDSKAIGGAITAFVGHSGNFTVSA